MAGRGLFNKLVDTFNTVADDARRQLATKDTATKAPVDQEMHAAPTDSERAVSHLDSAREVSQDSGRAESHITSAREVAQDSGRRAAAEGDVGCKFCGTPVDAGKFCTGCGAAVDR